MSQNSLALLSQVCCVTRDSQICAMLAEMNQLREELKQVKMRRNELWDFIDRRHRPNVFKSEYGEYEDEERIALWHIMDPICGTEYNK